MAKGKFLDLHRHLPSAAFVLVLLLVFAGFAGAFIYAGVYNIGADAPHSKFVYMTLDQMRERAIRHHARNIAVPADFDDPKRIATGAGLYSEMCTGCHLGPGVEKSEMSQGLYPPAPELSRGVNHTPAEMFWIIKHGVKLSAMPAWGKTHDDNLIWDMVAFARALPKMSPEQYQAALASAPADHDEMMKAMPGMAGMSGMKAGESAKPTQAGHSHAPGTKPHAD
ncbi:MAG: cytochrome c [Sphingomonas sp.]|nr:cytochrome c [Sphingomonas sp.]